MERAFWLLDRGARFNGVGVATVRGPGPLPESLVRAALVRLQAQHPFLRMRVVGDDHDLRFTEHGAGPLPLRVLTTADWQTVVEDELNLRFADDTDHLTRLTLLRDPADPQRSQLLITHHHVITDAFSNVFVVRDLLTQLAALLGPQAPPPVRPLPLLPPLSVLLPAAARGLGRLGQMSAFFSKYVLGQRHARKLPSEQPAPPEQRRNRLVQRTLPPEQTLALGQQARAAGASVHGVLCAALLLATAEVAYATELAAATPTTVGCFTALNLREQLEPPVGESLGLYMSQVTTFHQIVPPPPLWQLAREVKEQLRATLLSGEQYLTMPLIGLFIPWGNSPGPRFIRRFDGGSPAALGVSNLARPPIPHRYGPLTLADLHLAVGVSVVGQLMGQATTWEDRLHLNLVFSEPLVSRARAERIIDGALAHLRAALAAAA